MKNGCGYSRDRLGWWIHHCSVRALPSLSFLPLLEFAFCSSSVLVDVYGILLLLISRGIENAAGLGRSLLISLAILVQ